MPQRSCLLFNNTLGWLIRMASLWQTSRTSFGLRSRTAKMGNFKRLVPSLTRRIRCSRAASTLCSNKTNRSGPSLGTAQVIKTYSKSTMLWTRESTVPVTTLSSVPRLGHRRRLYPKAWWDHCPKKRVRMRQRTRLAAKQTSVKPLVKRWLISNYKVTSIKVCTL